MPTTTPTRRTIPAPQLLDTAASFASVETLEARRLLSSAGQLDPTFGTNGSVFVGGSDLSLMLHSVVERPDGRLVAGGASRDPGFDLPGHSGTVMRFLANGQIDTTFGLNGFRNFSPPPGASDSAISQVVNLADNRLLIGLFYGEETGFRIMRLHSSGTPDDTFGIEGVLDLDGYGGRFTLAPDGNIVVAGENDELAESESRLFVFTPDGQPRAISPMINLADGLGVESFSPHHVDIAPNGDILVGGVGRDEDGFASEHFAGIARFNYVTLATVDSWGGAGLIGWDLGGDDNATTGMHAGPEGNVIFSVSWDDQQDLIARLSNAGQVLFERTFFFGDDATRDPNELLHLRQQADGRIVGAGHYRPQGPEALAAGVARFLPSGDLDPSFGGDPGPGEATFEFLVDSTAGLLTDFIFISGNRAIGLGTTFVDPDAAESFLFRIFLDEDADPGDPDGFANLTNGRLTVNAGDSGELITVSAISNFIRVQRHVPALGTQAFDFDADEVDEVFINGGLGDDAIEVGDIDRPIVVHGRGGSNFVNISGNANHLSRIFGSPTGNDTLIAGDGPTRLFGLGGNNSLVGGPANDTLWGGDGDDVLDVSAGGHNRLVPGLGRDTLRGGDGFDTVDYREHHIDLVLIRGSAEGDDDIDDNIDIVLTGRGNDELRGFIRATTLGGNNLLVGHPTLPSALFGGDGDDTLQAGNGGSYLHGGAGNNTLQGGLGNDTLVGGSGSQVMSAGPGGRNALDYRFFDQPIRLNLAFNSVVFGNGGATHDLDGLFRDALGTPFDDEIFGNDHPNYIDGGMGNDTIFGGGGGKNILVGSQGANQLTGGPDWDLFLTRGDGGDTIDGGGGFNRALIDEDDVLVRIQFHTQDLQELLNHLG